VLGAGVLEADVTGPLGAGAVPQPAASASATAATDSPVLRFTMIRPW
jgi:hypothetical protein